MTRSGQNHRGRHLGRGLVGTFALAAAVGLTSLCLGAELRLKSGQTWRGELNDTVEVVFTEGGREQRVEGKLVRADSTMVVVETMSAGKVAKRSIFFGDVKSMKSVGAAEKPADAAASPDKPAGKPGDKPATGTKDGAAAPADASKGDGKPAAAATADDPNFKGVFFLPLEGMVGTGMRHDEIDEIVKEADKAGPGQIIVLEIDSPGGMVLEAQRIHGILKEVKKRHRLVAWIKKAISAAAFTALHCDEIYFMNMGSLGSMTMFSGKEDVAKGESLEAWLALAGEVAKESGRDPQIAKCMIVKDLVVSYDIPEGGGPKDARFRPDAKGKVLLDGPDTMLTFTASEALACGFSDGTADTPEELAKLMGLPKWKEAGDTGRKIYRDWQSLLERGTEAMVQLVVQFNYKGESSGDPEKALAVKINIIEDLIKWHDRCWSCAIKAQFEMGVGVPPKEYLEQMLKELKKELADMKSNRRDREKAGRQR